MNPNIALEWFGQKQQTDELRKKTLKKVKNTTLEWKKIHLRRE